MGPMAPTQHSASTRYAALVRLLLRHGRSDLVRGAQLDEFNTDATQPIGDEDLAETFANDLEEMGPTYIKLGQLLSTRPDLMPPAYLASLSRLQDDVEPFPFDQVRAIVEEELGADLRTLFTRFDETPMAAASIGQVHRATTRTGREVVVKVQRPGIRGQVRGDMDVLGRLARWADDHLDVGRAYGFSDLLAEFRRSLAGELDYTREARNLQRFGELTRGYEHLTVPQPIMDYTTSRVLTMDFVDGRKLTDITPLGMTDIDGPPLVEDLFRAYLRMILVDGVLHADPHPGNLLLTTDGRIALLDLGMVASVPSGVQSKVVKLLLAISDVDGEEVAEVLAELGHPLATYDSAAFRVNVSHLVSEAMARGGDVEVGAVMMELSRVSAQHGLRPPAEMAMIGKALLNLDQAIHRLAPDFSPTEEIRRNASHILAGGLKVSPGGLVAAALEAKEFSATLPRRANRILDSLAEGELTFRINAIDEERLLVVLQRLANRLTMGLILAAIVVGASLVMRVPSTQTLFGYPAIAMVFFLVAALSGTALIIWIVVTDRRVAREARARHRRP